jgi:hypothetical protein
MPRMVAGPYARAILRDAFAGLMVLVAAQVVHRALAS